MTLSREAIVLASNSVSRKAMLEGAHVAFEAVGAEVDERALEAEMADASSEELVQALSAAKAADVSARHPGKLVLGSDSTVEVDTRRFHKPVDRVAAADHLRAFSGKTMTLHSAAALARDGKIVWLAGDFARMQVRELSEDFIAAYLDAEWPHVASCVGVFRIEAAGAHLFDRITGDQFTILGMPLLKVLAALRKEGVLL